MSDKVELRRDRNRQDRDRMVKRASGLANLCCSSKALVAVEEDEQKRYTEWIQAIEQFQDTVRVQDPIVQDAWNKTFDMLKRVNGFVDPDAARNILYCCLPICLDSCSDYTVEELSGRSYMANFQSKAWDADENRRIRFEIECRLIPFPS